MRMIVTSSWFTPLPATYLRIGVSRSVPRGYPAGYRRLKTLEPGDWLHAPPDVFIAKYRDHLARLDAREVLNRIGEMAAGFAGVALYCYESPTGSTWCHRALISQWLGQQIGLCVPEFGREQCGCGAQHPLRYRFASD
jgi:hypothetical protein